jgi:hypothetical protein
LRQRFGQRNARNGDIPAHTAGEPSVFRPEGWSIAIGFPGFCGGYAFFAVLISPRCELVLAASGMVRHIQRVLEMWPSG